MPTTTDSSTPCSKSPEHPAASAWGLGWLLFGLCLLLTGTAHAADQGIGVKSASLEVTEEGWQLSADFDIQFTPTLQEAVNRGVPLYFIIEFEARSPRWYWIDRKDIIAVRERRISYAPLTQQYRLAIGNFTQNVASFDDVKYQLSRLRGWRVSGRDSLRPGEKYEVQVRMRLDTSQLPKPFQLTALASRDWNLASDWYRWTLTP